MSRDQAWDHYVEALDVIVRAPRIKRARVERLDENARQRLTRVDDALRTTVSTRHEVQRRLDQLRGLCNKIVTEHRVPTTGVVMPVRIPVPGSLAEALRELDQLETHLRSDAEQLDRARLMAPPPPEPPRSPVVVVVAVSIAILIIVIIIISAL